jgi:chromate transporter
VAQAVWGMAGTLCPDRQRAAIALLVCFVLLVSWKVSPLFGVALGALAGLGVFFQG